ncbi:MAG: R3H domain-containing nucleic acid-binding protein [Verrucomicrobiota bacterium]|nr:R3H domain-containing nucleic acid-binding protein [Verrucomicrobiota bacterium]
MVTHLGYEVTIEEEESEEGACLQVLTEESDLLIGNHGDRLDDLQYLVNRILQKKMQDPPRIRIDCDHFRVRQEEKLITTARELADKAKDSGKPMKMRPLNAYHRRIVHNALIDDDEVETVSPRSDERLKRILIQPVS